MKKSKHSEIQILKILSEHENGRKVNDLCREYGISQPTFYNWKSTSVYYNRPKRRPQYAEIRAKLADLAEVHSQWGFWMMHHHLRLNHYRWNHKRVYRIYTEMGMNLRRKFKKPLPERIKQPLVQPLFANMTWSMDFMSDELLCGQSFRSFNVIDDYNREGLQFTMGTSINSKRVIRELQRLISWRGKPEKLRVRKAANHCSA